MVAPLFCSTSTQTFVRPSRGKRAVVEVRAPSNGVKPTSGCGCHRRTSPAGGAEPSAADTVAVSGASWPTVTRVAPPASASVTATAFTSTVNGAEAVSPLASVTSTVNALEPGFAAVNGSVVALPVAAPDHA